MRFVRALSVVLLSIPAFGAVVTLNTASRGWIKADGTTNGSLAGGNYFAGYSAPDQELRDWFQFSIPTLNGDVAAAVLHIETASYLSHDPSETYQITNLPSVFGFADLGTGTLYASRVYTAADNNLFVDITLDAAAIAAIQSGTTFGLGGRLTTLSGQTQQSEAIFGSSNVFGPSGVQLVITTAPEPGAWLLLASGLGLGLAGRRKTLRD